MHWIDFRKDPMTYFLIISSVVGGWAMLRLMGAERSQMITELESQLRREQQQLPAPGKAPPAPSADPAVSPKTKH